jgi:hypothetical protein
VPDYENSTIEDNPIFDEQVADQPEDNVFHPDSHVGSPGDQPPLSDDESIDTFDEYHPIINGMNSV